MLSVIIPVLNAGKSLGETLDAVSEAGRHFPCETIVVDGGSTDDTAQIAARHGAILINSARGRGVQLAAGAAAAAGDWFFFLHADTRPQADWIGAFRKFITADNNRRRAAVLHFRLDDPGFSARLVERAVAVRGSVFGLPYGDQGLLISRAFYEEIGGYKRIPLMEDVDIVRRIGRRRLRVLDAIALTSAARYRRDGYLMRSLRNLICLGLYKIGASPRFIANFYEAH
ncbi:MAG: TIGR04283 family arsenosugar biosynthesis glycosyltransferase [Rhodospirillales bacterium]|nr:TIGR04283 family arsenosugar biosynthesis glycosyltransferase [Rhodospirillales bacterium]